MSKRPIKTEYFRKNKRVGRGSSSNLDRATVAAVIWVLYKRADTAVICTERGVDKRTVLRRMDGSISVINT